MRNEIKTLIASILEIDVSMVTDEIGPLNYSEWDSLVHLSIMEGLVHLYGEKIYQSEKLSECTSVHEIIEEVMSVVGNNA